MMSVLLQKMREFILTKQGGARLDWLIEEVMVELEQICRVAETGEYPLISADEVDERQVCAFISKASGRAATRLEIKSCSALNSRDDWNRFFLLIRREFGKDLAEVYLPRIGMRRIQEIIDDPGEFLAVPFGAALFRRLGLAQSVGTDDEGKWFIMALIQKFGMVQGGILLNFIAAAILQDTEILERIYPLVQLMPKIVIIGELKDEPGAWLVLTA